ARRHRRRNFVEPRALIRAYRYRERAEVVDQLLLGARPDDRRGDTRLGGVPRERELRRRAALLVRERDDGFDDVERLRRDGPVEVVLAALPAALRSRVLAPVLAGQQPAAERSPRNHAEAEAARGRQHLALGGPVEQVVGRLLADEAIQTQLP